MNLRLFVRILRKGAWVLVVLTVAGAALGAAFAYLSTPTFGVRATVYVTLEGAANAGDLQTGNVYVQQKAGTFANLASTDLVLDRAAAALGGGTTADDLRASTTTTARDQSSVIDVLGSGPDARTVTAQTNAVAEALVATVESSAEQPVDSSDSRLRVTATIADPAVLPKVAQAPQPKYDIFAGLVIGLVLAVAVLVVRQAVDNRIYSLRDLPADRSLVTRTVIPARRVGTSREAGEDLQMEAFRGLRANLQFGSSIGRSIAVAPVGRETNANAVAERLGRVLLEVGLTVAIVDVDFRPDPSHSGRRAGRETMLAAGTSAFIRGTSTLQDVARVEQTPAGRMHRISIDSVDDDSQHLLSTPAMDEALQELERTYACTVLVCPPLTERADAVAVAAVASSTIVVATGGATRRPALRFALSLLQGVRAAAVSVVLVNGQPD